MKVAIIIDTWFPILGGGQTNALQIASRIASKNLRIDILTRDCGIVNDIKHKHLRILRLCSTNNPSNYFSKIEFTIRAFLYVQKNKYDLVHAYAFLPGVVAKLFMIFNKKPGVFSVFGTSVGTSLNGTIKTFVEKIILLRTSYSVQIADARSFVSLKNINTNVEYIPNGVEISKFNKVNAKKFKRPTILFVARLHPQKNPIGLISAMSYVVRSVHDVELVIIGKGELEAQLRKLVIEKHLENHIAFRGEVFGSKLINFYKSSHILALPSIYEGQPIVVVESMASRLPVVAARTGDIPFMIDDGVNGYLIPNARSSKSIATTIIKALKNKNLADVGEKGYIYARKNFSWSKSAKKIEKIYLKCHDKN